MNLGRFRACNDRWKGPELGVEWAACRGGRPGCLHSMSLSRRPVGTAVTQVIEVGNTKVWQGVGCVLRGGHSELINSIQWGEG